MNQDQTIIANAYRLPSYMTPWHEQMLADIMAERCRKEGHRPQTICNSRLTAEAHAERAKVVADRIYTMLCRGSLSMFDIRRKTQVHRSEVDAALAILMRAGKARRWEVEMWSKRYRVMYGAIQ